MPGPPPDSTALDDLVDDFMDDDATAIDELVETESRGDSCDYGDNNDVPDDMPDVGLPVTRSAPAMPKLPIKKAQRQAGGGVQLALEDEDDM